MVRFICAVFDLHVCGLFLIYTSIFFSILCLKCMDTRVRRHTTLHFTVFAHQRPIANSVLFCFNLRSNRFSLFLCASKYVCPVAKKIKRDEQTILAIDGRFFSPFFCHFCDFFLLSVLYFFFIPLLDFVYLIQKAFSVSTFYFTQKYIHILKS